MSRAKLYDLWSTVFNENDDLTPHRFLQWVLLLRGLAASDARGVGDRTVALRLRVPRSTLTHATRDLLGTTFSDVEEGFWLKPVIEFEGLLTKLGVVADRRIA